MKLFQKQKTGEMQDGAVPKKKTKMRKRIIALLLVITLLCGAGFGVKALFFTKEEQVALTEMTTYGSLATSIQGTGTTVPADSFSVTAASGDSKITAVYVSAGDSVEVGQLLYTQDDSELDDQLDEYQKQIDDLYDQISNYSDQIDNYNDKISDLQETMAELTVTAPFSGRVIEVAAHEGDQLQKGSRLAVLVDDSQMTLAEYFSYAYESDIYVGMSAGVSIPSLMNTFSGTVTGIKKVERLTTEGDRCFALRAADEIARQLRLRDMGGIIVVDFIDMSKAEHRQKLYDHMRELMSTDRARHNILPLSKFGLMQITRQRVRPDLEIETSEKCPSCHGKGEIQPSILFTDTLREKLDYCINGLGKQNFTMYVHPYVEAYIKKGLFSSIYRTWRSELGKKFKIVADQSLAYLQYKVIGSDKQEIDLREEKDISSSASKTKSKAKTRSKDEDSSEPSDK